MTDDDLIAALRRRSTDEQTPLILRNLYTVAAGRVEDLQRLETAIREHRDTRGDDRCWRDDEDLYRALPEGYTPPARDTAVELDRCRQFIASRHNPATVYISPQRRIDELEDSLGKGSIAHTRETVDLDPSRAE